MDLKLTISDNQLSKVLEEFKHIPNGARLAIMHGLNKTIVGVRTDAKKALVEKYHVRAGDANKTMVTHRAYMSNLEASITSAGRVIPLMRFRVSPKKPLKRRRPLTVEIIRGQPKQIAHRWFLANVSGHIGVFRRTEKTIPARRRPGAKPRKASLKPRQQIREVMGPALPSMLGTKPIFERIQAEADKRLEKAIDHEVKRILDGHGL